MVRTLTKFWLVLAFLLAASRSAHAYSLLGPNPAAAAPDGWEQPVIGYQLTGDIGTPKNLGEGYRWNTPTLYYACDANFLNYFGSNGLTAVDQAFSIINNLNNVDSYSPTLAEWPLDTTRINERADALGLTDLRSALLHLIVEQLGLAPPNRYVWTLHARIVAGPVCPIDIVYDVVQRSFDPVSFQPSSYVNGTLYSYEIEEACTGPNPLAVTLNFPVDPAAPDYTAVAADPPGLSGFYYTGLTRDDVGGLRYAWATNRIYNEAPAPTALLQAPAAPTLLVTSNLSVLLAALTNTPAALQALFPTLQITSVGGPVFEQIPFTNFVLVTNPPPPGSPITTPPTTNTVPVVTTNLTPIFTFTFGNVITNFTFTNNGILATNFPGEYLLVPSNVCGFQILSNGLTSVVITTNTNTSTITLFTNHTLVVDVFNCVPNSIALREGMEKIRFFRKDFDSLVGQTWTPITNTYTLTAVSNGVAFVQTFFRVATQPDFLISAQDFGTGSLEGVRSITFNAANAGAGLAGPGTINPATSFILNKAGAIYQNPSAPNTTAVPVDFIPPFNESTAALFFQWGSFDGTTNDPIAYPVGTSIVNLENNIFLQITVSGPLPNGNVNKPYGFQLPVTGNTPPPYSWTLVSLLPGVPPASQPAPGLSLSPTTGLISGTPTATGIYDFTVQVTDANNRVSQRTLQIEIDP